MILAGNSLSHELFMKTNVSQQSDKHNINIMAPEVSKILVSQEIR